MIIHLYNPIIPHAEKVTHRTIHINIDGTETMDKKKKKLGEQVRLTCHVEPNRRGLSYQWSKQGQDLLEQRSEEYTIESFKHEDVGRYTCTVKFKILWRLLYWFPLPRTSEAISLEEEGEYFQYFLTYIHPWLFVQ